MAADLQILSDEDRQIIEKAQAVGPGLLPELKNWALHNTGSWNVAGLQSFAPIVRDAFSLLQGRAELVELPAFQTVEKDGKRKNITTAPALHIVKPTGAPTRLVLTGHYDTVFAPGVFETITQLDGGRLNGPGLTDMKGGLMVMLHALALFESGPMADRIDYEIVISPDEEIGNFASAGLIEKAARAAHIGLTFEPAMEDGALAAARKASAVYDVVFEGVSAHAGRAKHEGKSAIAAAAYCAAKLEDLNNPGDPSATFNIGAIDGGGPVNIVPDRAVLRLGARALDKESADVAHQKIAHFFDEACLRYGVNGEILGGFYRPAKPRNQAQNRLIEAVKRCGAALDLDLQFKDTGGVCEGNNVFAAGTPNIDTLGVRGGRIHSTDEFLIPESLSERIALTGLILNRLADGRLNAASIKASM